MIFIRGQESCSFLFPVLGSLGASLLAQGCKEGGGNRQWWFLWSWGIVCWLWAAEASQARGSHRGQRIHGGDGGRPLCHAPTFLAGGGLRAWWEAAGVSLYLAAEARDPISMPPRWL